MTNIILGSNTYYLRPGETKSVEFRVTDFPSGNMSASIIGGDSLIRVDNLQASRIIHRDLTEEEIEQLEGHPQKEEIIRYGHNDYELVATASEGTPIAVTPDLNVIGIIKFEAPASSEPITKNAKLVVNDIEVPILFIVGGLQVEFLLDPVVAYLDEWVDVPIKITSFSGPTTDINIKSFDPWITIAEQTLTVPSGGIATTILKLKVSEVAPLGLYTKNINISADGRDYPFNIEIKERPKEFYINAKIQSHWEYLHRAPGMATSDLIAQNNSFLINYENGAIYAKNAIEVPAWVPKEIMQKYNDIGGSNSWLGLPTHDVVPLRDIQGGQICTFENGEIYFWHDTGAIALQDVVISYTGIHCFDETDYDGLGGINSSDEVWAQMGVTRALIQEGEEVPVYQVGIYEGVDGRESINQTVEIYRGRPFGVQIALLVMEHDEENPDRYKADLKSSCESAAKELMNAARSNPIGAQLVPIVEPILLELSDALAEELNDLLNLEDDLIGNVPINLTCKEMVVLSAITQESVENDINYKKSTDLLTGDNSGYKVYFTLQPVNGIRM